MSGVDFSSFTVDQGSLHAAGDAHLGLKEGNPEGRSPLRLNAQFRGADVPKIVAEYSTFKLPMSAALPPGR